MMLFCRGTVAVVCVVWLTALGAPLSVATAPVPVTDEVRGLWVLRSSLASADRVDEVIRTAVDGGYNTLLVQVRGRGDAYYTSTLEPRALELQGQPATFDPLQRTIDRAHAAGLQVHAWLNVNLVASAATLPQASTHVMVRHPAWVMVP
ncbi:MAG: family 10 glycosylhydrolase, partial [Acidobacteria bacterium]|nr:family 10 glycosylhydrolase [Acidobacteriota bacterium]